MLVLLDCYVIIHIDESISTRLFAIASKTFIEDFIFRDLCNLEIIKPVPFEFITVKDETIVVPIVRITLMH